MVLVERLERRGRCRGGAGRAEPRLRAADPKLITGLDAARQADDRSQAGVELQLGEPRVEAAARDQAASCVPSSTMRPLVEHQDAVAGQHGREPVRDHQRGAALHQPLERRLHQRLALGVERRGRLVEQQERRVAQDRARDRDALALAAGQRHAALADRRVVALRQPVG